MKLAIEDIYYAYDSGRELLHGISFDLGPDEILCILGPNGCGKTTMLNCIMALLKINRGRILLGSEDISRLQPVDVAKSIGYVPQTIVPSFDYTVIDYVVTGCAPHLKLFKRPGKAEYSKADAAIERMGIGHIRDKSYSRISGGERQQVSIARVLTQEPRFILLDEPTSHLDFGNQVKVLSTIKTMSESGFGILMTTHNPDHVLMLGGKVAMMGRDGSFAFGEAGDIVTEDSLHALYGTQLHLLSMPEVDRKVCAAPKL